MKTFLAPLQEIGGFEEICSQMQTEVGMHLISGCMDTQKNHLIYAAGQPWKYRLILTFSDVRAREIYEDYRFFDREVQLFPARDLIFLQADIQGNLLSRERIRVLKALQEKKEITIITTIAGCMDYLLPMEKIQESTLHISLESVLDPAELAYTLNVLGYQRNTQIDEQGQYALRGGIIDIFPLTEETPVRIELWGDEINSIRRFEVETQRSLEELKEIAIYPVTEMPLTEKEIENIFRRLEKEGEEQEQLFREKAENKEATQVKNLVNDWKEKLLEFHDYRSDETLVGYLRVKKESFLDYFPKEETLVVLDEPLRLREQGEAVEMEFQESMVHRLEKGYVLPGLTKVLFSYREIAGKLLYYHCMGVCALETAENPWKIRKALGIQAHSVNSYSGNFEMLVRDLQRWKKNGYRMVVLCPSGTRARRLAEDLREYELNSFYTDDLEQLVRPGQILFTKGQLRQGFEYPLLKFVVLSESDIFGREKTKPKKKKTIEGNRINSFMELNPGDYVVHENHGLGIYKGIEKVEVDRIAKDYMKIEYAGKSNLYILATQLDMIQKYSDSDAKPPQLNQLGTPEWRKTKNKVRSAVREIAADLVKLYAVRQQKNGYVYGTDTVWQREFEEMFPFEETQDQLIAIEDAKKDMESTKIMDRLICGDVGYGKTEVALRAAFKAVQESKQVVYLVPTTILAQQHYNTFRQRMKDFPVRVDLLCRFSTQAQQKKTIQDLKKGLVDIVIGTHRILSKDVVFKDLGLLIIDEEQRFGVTHKEKIKKMKENVDVMALTATPIPRTLHMSLIGIRDMSVLEEAPQDRQPIQTYVMEFNEEMVREAISREVARGGQVYYVYNRVNTIAEITGMIQKLVPSASVAFAHGQMTERQLEKIMYQFINGEVDVLVATTIIETGLDISNVNTMIIHDADRFGLSQLYQLRGRVGRSNRTSYAFLMYQRNKMLKEVAEKRLAAIREYTEMGSGFKIAMRDLEIRGAGNLLGDQQHGHMAAVGYDLYCKMLNEAVKEAKGDWKEQDCFNTTIDMEINAFIPIRYISNENQKLDVYKRIAEISNAEEYDDMVEELLDRFGEMPKSVQDLLKIALLKAKAHSIFITDLVQKRNVIRMVLYEKASIRSAGIDGLLKSMRGRMKFSAVTPPVFEYTAQVNSKKEMLTAASEVVDQIILFCKDENPANL